jgi:hypothetical protein
LVVEMEEDTKKPHRTSKVGSKAEKKKAQKAKKIKADTVPSEKPKNPKVGIISSNHPTIFLI